MRLWLNIFALGSCLGLASNPCRGEGRVYEIGYEEKSIDVESIKYYIEPASIPLDVEKFRNFSQWKITKEAKHLTTTQVSDSRLVLSFNLKALVALPIYFNYPWISPFNFAKFAVFDSRGVEMEAKVFRESSPLWSAYLEKGDYNIIFIVEPKMFSSAKLVIRVMNPAYMLGTVLFENRVKFFIYAVGISFIFFSLCMFILNKRMYFIYYIGYSCTILYLLASGSSHVPYPSGILGSISLILNAVFAVFMSSSVLRTREIFPRFLRFSFILIGLSSVSFFVFLVFGIANFRFIAYAFGMIVYFMCVLAALRRMLQGYVPAIFFGLGWAALLIGLAANGYGVYIKHIPALIWAPFVSYALEAILFAVALAYRARDSERLVIQEKMHALSQLQKVVYPHQIEQIKAGLELEATMPTSSGHACVLSFDIVGSSKIKHINTKLFLRNVFAKCNAIMSEGYDGHSLRANAYRIKEMGDGFLCSIGYPFQSISNNPANDAVDLAKRFVQVLAVESKILHSPIPIACGIGIALDGLTGFYPEGGTKEYDIYGPALILAKRYEGMRKTIFEAESNLSILIIQELVFLSLDPNHRFGFIAMDLKEMGIVVRDDSAASKLYYQFLDDPNSVALPPETMEAAI